MALRPVQVGSEGARPGKAPKERAAAPPSHRTGSGVAPAAKVPLNEDLVGLDAVLFLDVDGVLHPPNPRHSRLMFRTSCMDVLRDVLTEVGAKVVLSTTWRLNEGPRTTLSCKLIEHGCPTFVSRTPNIAQFQRPREILAWVDKYKPATWVAVDDWPLLDDMDRIERMRDHFVQTKGRHGLLPENAERIKALFAQQRDALAASGLPTAPSTTKSPTPAQSAPPTTTRPAPLTSDLRGGGAETSASEADAPRRPAGRQRTLSLGAATPKPTSRFAPAATAASPYAAR